MNEFRVTKLIAGAGSPDTGGCWMSAISVYAGERWSDHPECVCPVIRGLCIQINDMIPTDDERARLIGPRLFDPIGTAGDPGATRQRAYLAVDRAVRAFAPIALDAVGYHDLATRLRSLAPVSDRKTAADATRAARVAAGATRAARDAYGAAYAYAYGAARAAYVAAYAAAYAHGDGVGVGGAVDAAVCAHAACGDSNSFDAIPALFALLDGMLAVGPSAPVEPVCDPRQFAAIFARKAVADAAGSVG